MPIVRGVLAYLFAFALILPAQSASVILDGQMAAAVQHTPLIAFDGASLSSGFGGINCGTASSCSWSHTVTSNTQGILIVGCGIVDTNNTTAVTGMTYNGVALTKIRADNFYARASDATEIWALLSPATGAHTLAVTLNQGAAQETNCGSISLTRVHQSYTADASSSSPTNGAACTLTTVASNAWLVDVTVDNANIDSLPTGPAVRRWYLSAGGRDGKAATLGPIVTPGSASIAWTSGVSNETCTSWAPAP